MYMPLFWTAITIAAVLLIAGVWILIARLRGLSRARAAKRRGDAVPDPQPNPTFARYDPDNPHYQAGQQFIDGQWRVVQVWDETSRDWWTHTIAANGSPAPRAVGIPVKRPTIRGNVAGIVVASLMIGIGVPIAWFAGGPMVATGAAFGSFPQAIVQESDQYRYTAPMTITDTQTIDFQFRVDPLEFNVDEQLDDGLFESQSLVSIYQDAGLTQRADYGSDRHWGVGILSLKPEPIELWRVTKSGRTEIPNPFTTSWAPMSTMYVVQYRDRDGEEYKKPIVTRVDIAKRQLAAPDVHYAVENGALAMSWAAVPGATGYYPVYVEHSANGRARYMVLDELGADATAWSSSAHDNECAEAVNCSVQFVAQTNKLNQSDPKAGVGWATTSTDYGIIATGAAGALSGIGATSGSDIDAQLSQARSWDDKVVQVRFADAVPTSMNITTVANTQPSLPTLFGSADAATQTVDVVVAGSAFHRRFQYVGDDWPGFVSQVTQRLSRPSGVTGAIEASFRSSKVSVSQTDAISTTRPDVAYPVAQEFGAYGDYLAANLIDGQTRIDVSRFDDSPFSIDQIMDAVVSQNPFIVGFWGYGVGVIGGHTIVEVSYTIGRDEMAGYQKKMSDAADGVVSSVVSSGMSDRQKAKALNDWLVDHVQYDYPALNALLGSGAVVLKDVSYRDAWNAYGALLDGDAVCAGYAAAYKMLSDKAGLKTMYVTGNANGPHAWNKTFLDGKWTVVDPTWNDATPRDALFGITDSVALSQFQHKEDTDWTIPSMVGQYAAN